MCYVYAAQWVTAVVAHASRLVRTYRVILLLSSSMSIYWHCLCLAERTFCWMRAAFYGHSYTAFTQSARRNTPAARRDGWSFCQFHFSQPHAQNTGVHAGPGMRRRRPGRSEVRILMNSDEAQWLSADLRWRPYEPQLQQYETTCRPDGPKLILALHDLF